MFYQFGNLSGPQGFFSFTSNPGSHTQTNFGSMPFFAPFTQTGFGAFGGTGFGAFNGSSFSQFFPSSQTFQSNQQEFNIPDFGEFFNNILFGMDYSGFDFSNPEGFEDILNDLYHRYQPPGKPPASEDAINSCPMIDINAKHVEKKESCSICMEEFKINDKAMELPCHHLYHKDCVVTWLNTNNTCPVCRFELPTNNDRSKDNRNQQDNPIMEIIEDDNINTNHPEIEIFDLDDNINTNHPEIEILDLDDNPQIPDEVIEFIEIDSDDDD